jgi:hypothetical protein
MTHYLSPHSLGKQDELTDALKILCVQVRLNTKIFQYGKTNYSIYNTSVRCFYNDSNQTTDVLWNHIITITGGKVEFSVTFNY